MPRTPRVARPMGRTSDSAKRSALPDAAISITSRLPSVSIAATRWSPGPAPFASGSRLIAITPRRRALLNSPVRTFFTTPRSVAMNRYSSRENLLSDTMAVTSSSSSICSSARISWPTVCRVRSGSSCTLSQ